MERSESNGPTFNSPASFITVLEGKQDCFVRESPNVVKFKFSKGSVTLSWFWGTYIASILAPKAARKAIALTIASL
jgi:hypothetical protein